MPTRATSADEWTHLMVQEIEQLVTLMTVLTVLCMYHLVLESVFIRGDPWTSKVTKK